MPHTRSLREEESQLETNLKMLRMPAAQLEREANYLLASAREEPAQSEPNEQPLSYESLSRNIPADRVIRYFA
jgi:hypothetical protein